MSKNILIALIAVCAVAAIAGAAVAVMNSGNDSSNDNGGNDSGDSGTAAVMTGISILYKSSIASNSICVEYSDVGKIMDRISAQAVYSNGTTKALSDCTKTSTLGSSYDVGDRFTVTVSYGDYTASVNVTITEDDTAAITITCDSGSAGCYTITEDDNDEFIVTISGITMDTVYSISGTLNGCITIDAEGYDFELQMVDLMITSSYYVPITIDSGENVTISAKNGTVNTVTDNRDAVSDDGISACIYALCDLDIQGKGTLNVTSKNNNGIHTKDDLTVKNLTLYVECKDNSLKGNDSVTVRSGTITLIAKTGDCIKTTNSDISSKGNQRGTVTICSDKGNIVMNLYAACDGIDAAYDVIISESDGNTVTLNIKTDRYSEYSEDVTDIDSDDIMYLRTSSQSYNYSVYFYDSNGSYQWEDAVYFTSERQGMGTQYYYKVDLPTGYSFLKVYTYSGSQEQGQGTSYTSVTRAISINSSFNMLTINGNRYEWSVYGQGSDPGGMGPGGMDDGNTDKGDYSTKGIKADNAITMTGGTVSIESYDDSIHANTGTLENGSTGTGDVTVSGGTLTLYSRDDGIHGDGDVSISGGDITVTYAYEGIEGNTIAVSGGSVSVTSSDDGMNSTVTSGEGIVISGGYVYVYAGGDGLDSNSTSSYDGILFSGGRTVIIATSDGNSAIDTERGYRYTGGNVVAIGRYGGMSNETTNCSNFSSVGTYTSKQLTNGTYVTVGDIVSVRMPCAMSSQIVYIGSNSVNISTGSSLGTDDANGVCWA